jgi:hypothetical protein
MANPVGAVSHAPQVAAAHEAPAAKSAANVTKVTPQGSANISAAGKAASQRRSPEANRPVTSITTATASKQIDPLGIHPPRFGAPAQRPRSSDRG